VPFIVWQQNPLCHEIQYLVSDYNRAAQAEGDQKEGSEGDIGPNSLLGTIAG